MLWITRITISIEAQKVSVFFTPLPSRFWINKVISNFTIFFKQISPTYDRGIFYACRFIDLRNRVSKGEFMKNLLQQAVCGMFLAGMGACAWGSDAFVFDPDGPGGVNEILVQSFDWSPGSAVSVGAVPVPINPAIGTNTTYYQAKLTNFVGTNSLPISGTGLHTNYEVTIVVGFGETETGIDANLDSFAETAVFNYDNSNPVNHVRIYYDNTPDSNELDGTGFDDGILILEGTVTNFTGPFTATSIAGGLLDQFGADNHGGVTTVAGGGGQQGTMHVDYANTAFFSHALPVSLAFNTSIITPFIQVNPAKKVSNGSGGFITPNVGATNGLSTGGILDLLMQADANNSFTVKEIIEGACRMTGGGVTDDGQLLLDALGEPIAPAGDSDGKDRYTFGGQVGAPTAAAPDPHGEWTHHQYKGSDGDFVFRVGTASAPDDTRILTVICKDPGFCHPARPAPFKQLDFTGIGSFRTIKDSPNLQPFVITDNKPNYTRHYVKVHVEDIGEPGPGGKQPNSGDCTHKIGEPIVESEDCANCPDVYQIEIHATTDPSSSVIYSVGGFMDNGNIQIHPPIN